MNISKDRFCPLPPVCVTSKPKPMGLLLCSEGNTEHIVLLMLDEKK